MKRTTWALGVIGLLAGGISWQLLTSSSSALASTMPECDALLKVMRQDVKEQKVRPQADAEAVVNAVEKRYVEAAKLPGTRTLTREGCSKELLER